TKQVRLTSHIAYVVEFGDRPEGIEPLYRDSGDGIGRPEFSKSRVQVSPLRIGPRVDDHTGNGVGRFEHWSLRSLSVSGLSFHILVNQPACKMPWRIARSLSFAGISSSHQYAILCICLYTYLLVDRQLSWQCHPRTRMSRGAVGTDRLRRGDLEPMTTASS